MAVDLLHGDGLNLAFFNLLWSKDSNDDNADRQEPKVEAKARRNSVTYSKGKQSAPILRVPDTVVFLFGQPHQWYFTSKNGGPDKNKTTILRKRRANLTLQNIEDVFLNKSSSRGEDDVVAYFISTKNDGTKKGQHASLDACTAVVDDDISCDIEYLNRNSLHEFLQHGRNSKSGILQRFVAPHGGGHHNSQIRAVWTPKLCVLERRRTKQDLHDTRFALYERCITFDGPDVHSVSVPLRGTVLAGRVESICNEIVRHIADVSAENTRGSSNSSSSSSKRSVGASFPGVARMVLNFKVDGNGKIWILWSNSIRLQSVTADSDTRLTESGTHSSIQSAPSQPLNMETVVRLPSSVKLTQAPNHKASVKLDNCLTSATCPSCNEHDTNPHFQPVPYKTIIQHFEKTLAMLEEGDDSHPSKVWPPEGRFIKAAGNVGFGSLPLQLARDREGCPSRKFSEETHVIPPVIRQVHPKLRAQGYNMYRKDPLFLLKTASVCESCFLSYADHTTTSFTHIMTPIEPYESEDKEVHYNWDKAERKGRNSERTKREAPSLRNQTSILTVPELPPAITSPPILVPRDSLFKTTNSESVEAEQPSTRLQPTRDSLFNTLPTYFPSTDCAEKNLGHLIDSHKMLSAVARAKAPKNPYEENLENML